MSRPITVLRLVRMLRGLSLNDVSDAIGRPGNQIQLWEVGRNDVPRDVRAELSEFFGLPHTVLMTRADHNFLEDTIQFIAGRAT